METSRARLAIRRTASNERAKVARRISRNTLGWYRIEGGEPFAFNATDLEHNDGLRAAYVQAVLLTQTACRNVTWN
jgi:hypothetical protein